MSSRFAAAVPEMPIEDVERGCEYYESKLGFGRDWRDKDGGIAGVSRGDCRLFLADAKFRAGYGNVGPVLIWINIAARVCGAHYGQLLRTQSSRRSVTGACSN